MIKVLFVHDGPLYYDSDHRFYGVHYSDKIIERYLNLGSRVTFLIRTKKAEKDQLINLSLITNKSFSVKSFPNFKGISLFLKNKNKAKLIIENTVKEHDIIVIRMPSASGTIAFKMGKKLGKPCMVELVACTFDAYWNYDWRGKIIAHYKLLQQKLILKKASYVIYVTKEFLQKRYPTRGKSISCSNVALPAIKP